MPDFENNIDLKKLNDFAKKCGVKISVGFLGGVQHVPTRHKGKSGEYESINGGPPNEEPVETAELAKRLSYGDGNFPPRPFLEEGLAENAGRIKAAMKTELEKVHNEQKPNWDIVGSLAAGAVKDFVYSDYYKTHVPNSQRTIEWKGSDKPLIDGGNLVQSITFIVDK